MKFFLNKWLVFSYSILLFVWSILTLFIYNKYPHLNYGGYSDLIKSFLIGNSFFSGDEYNSVVAQNGGFLFEDKANCYVFILIMIFSFSNVCAISFCLFGKKIN